MILVASGGRRNRSGPSPDPNSATSDRRGYKLTALPAEGYSGPVPEFPLPKRIVWNTWIQDGEKCREVYAGPTEQVWERELEFWAWLWTTPQACAWSLPSEGWRLHTVAMYVRTFVICEGSEATAADKNSLHRFADQIGMTTAGLAEMGWAIAKDEVGEKRADHDGSEQDGKPGGGSRSRLKVVGGGK